MLAAPLLDSTSSGVISSYLTSRIRPNAHDVLCSADRGPQFAVGEVVNGEYRVRAVEEDEQGRIIHKVRFQLLFLLGASSSSARSCRMGRMS